jgi:hypothetical protein
MPAMSRYLALALIAVAGAARAEIAPGALASAVRAAPQSALDVPQAALVLPRDLLASVVRVPGVAKTSVDHSFAQKGLSGVAGFICGLEPSKDTSGGATAYGYDPHGRFVGAKLTFAFR